MKSDKPMKTAKKDPFEHISGIKTTRFSTYMEPTKSFQKKTEKLEDSLKGAFLNKSPWPVLTDRAGS